MDSIVIPQVDNDIFNSQSESWWSDNGLGAIIRCICNPWRVPYFQRILKQKFENSHGKRLLDLGCGGGLLAEEFTLVTQYDSGKIKREEFLELGENGFEFLFSFAGNAIMDKFKEFYRIIT